MKLAMLRNIVLLPGNVLVVIPAIVLWLTAESAYSWQLAPPDSAWFWFALAFISAGLGLIAWTMSLFLRIGEETHAPWEPTRNLVAAGPYRHLRNPMISGVIAVLLGRGCAVRLSAAARLGGDLRGRQRGLHPARGGAGARPAIWRGIEPLQGERATVGAAHHALERPRERPGKWPGEVTRRMTRGRPETTPDRWAALPAPGAGMPGRFFPYHPTWPLDRTRPGNRERQMRKIPLLLTGPVALGLALGFTLTAAAAAQQQHAGAGRFFDKLDGNKDGVITREEVRAARTRRFDNLDKNQDGNISLEEFQSNSDRHFARFDLDGDGKVTREEAAQARREHRKKKAD
jgi:hypothetical protein